MAKKYKKMQEGGSTISNADREMMQNIIDNVMRRTIPAAGMAASAKKAAERLAADRVGPIAKIDPSKEADRLARLARVKPPRNRGMDDSLAGDVTTGLGRTREDMENIARGGVKKMKYGGNVEKMERGGVSGGSCRGGGAALRGTKFSGVK